MSTIPSPLEVQLDPYRRSILGNAGQFLHRQNEALINKAKKACAERQLADSNCRKEGETLWLVN